MSMTCAYTEQISEQDPFCEGWNYYDSGEYERECAEIQTQLIRDTSDDFPACVRCGETAEESGREYIDGSNYLCAACAKK